MFRPRPDFGEIAASAARDADFLAQLFGVIEQHHAAAALARFDRAHHAGRAGADDDDVGVHLARYRTISRITIAPPIQTHTGTRAPLAGEGASGSPAAATAGATVLLKRMKKSSDIFFATPSISRQPICASLPPTLAVAL